MDSDLQVHRRVDEYRGRCHSDVHHLFSGHLVHIFGYGYACYHPDIPEQGGDGDTLGNDECQNGIWLGSQCLPDAELVGALLDGDEHDVAYSHNATEQGEDTDNPDGGTEEVAGRLLLQVLAEAVPYPDGTSVFGVELLHLRDGRTVFLLESFATGQVGYVLGEEYQRTHSITFIIYKLESGVGKVGGRREFFHRSGVDAYHLIGDATGVDVLADGFLLFVSHEHFHRLFMQDDDFSLVFHVQLVDESSCLQLQPVRFGIVGHDSRYLGRNMVLSVTKDDTALFQDGTGVGDVFRHLSGQFQLFLG